jgi:hypothetical protein
MRGSADFGDDRTHSRFDNFTTLALPLIALPGISPRIETRGIAYGIFLLRLGH